MVKRFITKERFSPYSLLLKSNFKNTPHFSFKFTIAALSAFYRQFEPQLLPPEGAPLASHEWREEASPDPLRFKPGVHMPVLMLGM